MGDLKQNLIHLLVAMWRRRWWALLAAWLICVGGWIGVYLIPNRYESQARIYVDADNLLTPLLRGIAVDTNPGRQVEFIQRTLLSRPNLEKLMRMTDLDLTVSNETERNAKLREITSSIRLDMQQRNLITLGYTSADPALSKRVVQGLITIFVESNIGAGRTDMDNAQKFLNEQIDAYEKQLRAAEQRKADFKQRYAEVLPYAGQASARLENLRSDLIKQKAELQDAQSRRQKLRQDLAATPALLSIDSAPQIVMNGRVVPSPLDQRIDDAEKALDQLRLRFTEQHPDVVAAKRMLASLQEQRDREKSGKTEKSAGGDGGRAVKTTVPNSIYEQIKLKLVDTEATIASLQRRIDEASQEIERVEKIQREAPNIDVELANLDRDYGIIQKNYNELLSRREAAKIAEAADVKTDKVQFRVVDPPQEPTQPSAPNRLLFSTAVLGAALAGGLALAFVLAQIDETFLSVSKLRELGLPVLGSISAVLVPTERRRRVFGVVGFVGALGCLLLVYGGIAAILLRANRHLI